MLLCWIKLAISVFIHSEQLLSAQNFINSSSKARTCFIMNAFSFLQSVSSMLDLYQLIKIWTSLYHPRNCFIRIVGYTCQWIVFLILHNAFHQTIITTIVLIWSTPIITNYACQLWVVVWRIHEILHTAYNQVNFQD